jgi:ABC-type dipeptide/oligopeptide/nickel transport system permease subunit
VDTARVPFRPVQRAGVKRFMFLRRLGPAGWASVGVCLILGVLLIAPHALAPYDPTAIVPDAIYQPPGPGHLMGTDQYGRDLLSRLIYGARVSMSLGVVSVTLSVALSLPLGIAAGYFRGRFEAVVMRLLDVLMAFPGILLALVVVAILGPGLVNAMIAVGLGEAPAYTRVARAAVLLVREHVYIEAARAVGARDTRILLRHVLPNVIQPVIIIATVGFAVAVIIGSSLGFLGLGAQPPTPEWGTMVAEGRGYLRTHWWIPVFPGLTIGLVVLALNILGDTLRDVLDPRLRR